MKIKMNRVLFCLTVLMALFLSTTVNTYADTVIIVDDADVFTIQEEHDLIEKIEEIKEEYDFDITFITTQDTEGQSLKEYIDNHPAINQNNDGLVFGQDVIERTYHTTARGEGVKVISDAALDRIDEVIVPYLQSENYYKAYDAYLDETIKFLDAAASGVAYEGESQSATDFMIAIAVGLVLGLIIALIATAIMKSNMNTARIKKEATNYVKEGSFTLSQNFDRFLYENTVATEKQQEKDDNDSHSHEGSGGGSY